MDWKIRAIFPGLLLFALYSQGVSTNLLLILALFFGILLLLRDKIWKYSEKTAKNIPLLRNWPAWALWILILLSFITIYYLLKLIIFSLLNSLGFDMEAELMSALNVTG